MIYVGDHQLRRLIAGCKFASLGCFLITFDPGGPHPSASQFHRRMARRKKMGALIDGEIGAYVRDEHL